MSGNELKRIQKWDELDDELDELQKIFFTFLKRWTESDNNAVKPNVLTTWEVYSDEEPFELDESTYSFNNILESDSYQNEIQRMQDDQKTSFLFAKERIIEPLEPDFTQSQENNFKKNYRTDRPQKSIVNHIEEEEKFETGADEAELEDVCDDDEDR